MLWSRHRVAFLMAVVGAFTTGAVAPSASAGEGGSEDAPQTVAAEMRVHSLKEFGPAGSRDEVQNTFAKAMEKLTAEGGGILFIPADAADADLENTVGRCYCAKPDDDDIHAHWTNSPPVLVIDNRGGNMVLRLPQVTVGKTGFAAGLHVERVMRLRHGDSVPHSKDCVLNLTNRVIHGTGSYRDVTARPAKAGQDARFYVNTIRGLYEGMFLNTQADVPRPGSKYKKRIGGVVIVKKIGYDKQEKLHYFTADTKHDWPAHTLLSHKTHVPSLRILSEQHAPNQTFDMYMRKHQYSHGDSYMYMARFGYMGNVHSTGGDENGACYTAYIYNLYNAFRGVVKSVDWDENKLVYERGENTQTLASTRPLINMNKSKWVTKGKVLIVPAESYWDTVDTGKYPYKGKTYPSTIVGATLRMGGLIRGDEGCPWDDSIIGRFFAVDVKSEHVAPNGFGKRPQGAIRRWYEITNLKINEDGTKDLFIKRFWWGAKEACSPTLYDPENYTYDGHERPLSYAIAPGAYVFDVSEAVASGRRPRTTAPLYVAPHPDTGTPRDFAPGDPIRQAIGADPFKPQAIRFIMADSVPGVWPAGVIDCYNMGPIRRDFCFKVRGRGRTLEQCAKRADRQPPYGSVLNIDCASRVGIDCRADFADAAILFRQPNHEQPIKWHYGERETGKPIKEALLKVSKDTGDLVFEGGDARFSGSVVAKGLSADDTPARNLRGKLVPLTTGTKKAEIRFPVPEPDANYAVFVEQTWLSNRAVTERTAEGFQVEFDRPAPEGATLDWMLVR